MDSGGYAESGDLVEGMGTLMRCYYHMLQRHQLATNMVTTGCVFFCGDMLAQQVRESP